MAFMYIADGEMRVAAIFKEANSSIQQQSTRERDRERERERESEVRRKPVLGAAAARPKVVILVVSLTPC